MRGGRTPPPREAKTHLPLPLLTFRVLVALARGEMHGYAIVQEVGAITGCSSLNVGASSLYRTIHRMLEQGFVAESSERPDPGSDDERRRYYRITPLGAAVARAESERLAELIELARAKGLGPREV